MEATTQYMKTKYMERPRMTNAPDQPVAESTVSSHLHELQGEIARLHEEFSALSERMDPVLEPEGPIESSNCSPRAMPTKIVDRLRESIGFIQTIRGNVNSTASRLQI